MGKRKKTILGVVHVLASNKKYPMTNARLRNDHKLRGFSDIGYNEWIDQKSNLHEGRGVEMIGAHVRGYNSVSYGIAMEGGLHSDDTTPEMKATLLKRMKEITKLYPDIKWCGHRDLSPDGDGDGFIEPHEHTKACPQFDVIPWAASHGLPVADIKGSWSKVKAPDKRDMWLQRLLRNQGYDVGPVDGIIGKKTRSAISMFQSDHGLDQTSKFDETTVALLRKRSEDGAVKVAVVPKALDKPAVKTGGFAKEVAALTMGASGLGLGAAFQDWRVITALFAGIVVLSIIGIFMNKKLVEAVKSIKEAVEG